MYELWIGLLNWLYVLYKLISTCRILKQPFMLVNSARQLCWAYLFKVQKIICNVYKLFSYLQLSYLQKVDDRQLAAVPQAIKSIAPAPQTQHL